MTPKPLKKELTVLKLRNAIVDKEWYTACANLDTARYDNWTCDWGEAKREADTLIALLLAELEN